ncbi:hypothetical protein DFP73DRAFT_562461 [Morchella snyderi]|nr:hypothetical protein DFP73DRAFT_562461 [Morchella snyderi]
MAYSLQPRSFLPLLSTLLHRPTAFHLPPAPAIHPRPPNRLQPLHRFCNPTPPLRPPSATTTPSLPLLHRPPPALKHSPPFYHSLFPIKGVTGRCGKPAYRCWNLVGCSGCHAVLGQGQGFFSQS